MPETNPGRRRFLANLVLGMAGALGLGTLGARFFSFLYPDVPPEQTVEIAVTERGAIPRNGGIIVHNPAGHIALEDTEGVIRAHSAVCTHLGCIIRWQPEGKQAWYCACHGGRYDRDGKVVGGPPPRPLPPLPVSVRDGRVFVTLKVRPPGELS